MGGSHSLGASVVYCTELYSTVLYRTACAFALRCVAFALRCVCVALRCCQLRSVQIAELNRTEQNRTAEQNRTDQMAVRNTWGASDTVTQAQCLPLGVLFENLIAN